jgi:hypothetical protein
VETVPPHWKAWAVLRVSDAKSRAPLEWDDRCRVALVVARGNGRLLVPLPWRLAADGRVEVYRHEDRYGDALPAGVDRADWDAASVEVRVPGYETREFRRRAELAGEREVELRPLPPSVTGVLRVGKGLEGRRVTMTLEPAVRGRDPRTADRRPYGGATEPGPFAWYEVPPARWRLDVWVPTGGRERAHASREFDVGETTVDLGTIEVVPPCAVRARVVARDGTAVLDRGLALERVATGEEASGGPMDDDGWVVFRGLEAATEYRVVSTLDGVAETVTTPTEGGGEQTVVLRWDNEGVRCRLRFTVEGQDPIQWGDVFEGPTMDKGAWKKDGTLEQDFAPGEFVIGILARAVGKEKPARYRATFTVPSKPYWEATIDLTESGGR